MGLWMACGHAVAREDHPPRVEPAAQHGPSPLPDTPELRKRLIGTDAMPVVRSFPPISRRDARVLILGTMPSPASLAARQFYGHRFNAFWRIMGELFGAGLDRPYAERTRRLKKHQVAVWDVLQQCERAGSLDSNIVSTSEVPNDFETFFARHRRVRAIFFNGTKASSSFTRLVLPAQAGRLEGIPLERLPSTSPANATFSFDQKLARWRRILDFLEPLEE